MTAHVQPAPSKTKRPGLPGARRARETILGAWKRFVAAAAPPRPALWYAAAALVALLAALVVERLRGSPDCAEQLAATDMLLRGFRPYVEVLGLDAPLLVYADVIPILVARVFPLHVVTAYNLTVWVGVAASVVACHRLLDRMPGLSRGRADAATLVWALFQLIPWLGDGGVRSDWGQREHLFVLAVAPYLVLRMLRRAGGPLPARRWQWTLGALAAAASALKPDLLLSIGVVEAASWWSLRRRRRPTHLRTPETTAFAVFLGVYLFHFALLGWDEDARFFGEWLPLVIKSLWGYDVPWNEVLLKDPAAHLGLAAGLAALGVSTLTTGDEPGAVRLSRTFGVLGAVSFVMLVAQDKGWSYHAIPGDAALAWTLALSLRWPSWLPRAQVRARLRARKSEGAQAVELTRDQLARRGPYVALGLAAAAALYGVADPDNALRGQTSLASALKLRFSRGDEVMVVDTSPEPLGVALLQAGLVPGSRFPYLYTVPRFYRGEGVPWPWVLRRLTPGHVTFPYHTPATATREEVRLLEELEEDVAKRKPKAILVRSGRCFKCQRGFELDDYLRSMGFFRHITGYRSVGNVTTATESILMYAADDKAGRELLATPPQPYQGDCPDGMMSVNGGEYVMGYTRRPIYVSTFCLDVHEVSVKAFSECGETRCAPDHPGEWTSDGKGFAPDARCNYGAAGREDHPMNCVDWQQARQYCARIGKRLPTEAEWEWAARGGAAARTFPWGNEAPDNRACWSGVRGRTRTCPVGSIPSGASADGILDLAGNVAEWTASPFDSETRVIRGGSAWTGDPVYFTTWEETWDHPTARTSDLGFRCASSSGSTPMDDVPGRAIWHELITSNVQMAAAFYKEVIGWDVRVDTETGFATFFSKLGPVAGISPITPEDREKGVPTFWSWEVSVDDVDASVKLAKDRGGKVVIEAADDPSAGRHALIADAYGAVLFLRQPTRPFPMHDPTRAGEFHWNELATPDLQALDFYGALFGWTQIDRFDLGPEGIYLTYGQGNGAVGAIHAKASMSVSAWVPSIDVADIDAACARAKAAGGKVTWGPGSAPDGRVAQVLDPQGAAFALHEERVPAP